MSEFSSKFFDFDPDVINVSDKNVKSFIVDQVSFKTIRNFVEKWHYYKTVNGLHCTLYFGLFVDGNLIGAMMYGKLAMPGVYKKYVEYEDELIELRRLCCIDATPKNTESYFVGKTIKWIKKNTKIKKIISYADPHYGHQGTIYKASNFKYLGITSPGRYIIDKDGNRKHDKTIRNSDVIDGVRIFRKHAIQLKEQLEKGEAKYIVTPGKHIYMYNL